MGSRNLLVALTLLAFASCALAYDPDPLQDFCVAQAIPNIFVNGNFCKDPARVNSNDFVFRGRFNVPGNTSNPLGFAVTSATVVQFGALNTLGISMVRIDYAPYGGLNPPHIHPRASELLALMEGTLLVGFVTSNPDNRLFSVILYPGDLFVFPKGLIHFQFNVGRTPAVAFAALGSQNPGVITVANAVFGSNPPIPPEVLERAFQVDVNVINQLQAPFAAR